MKGNNGTQAWGIKWKANMKEGNMKDDMDKERIGT